MIIIFVSFTKNFVANNNNLWRLMDPFNMSQENPTRFYISMCRGCVFQIVCDLYLIEDMLALQEKFYCLLHQSTASAVKFAFKFCLNTYLRWFLFVSLLFVFVFVSSVIFIWLRTCWPCRRNFIVCCNHQQLWRSYLLFKTYWPAGGGRGQNPENTAQGHSGQNAIRP